MKAYIKHLLDDIAAAHRHEEPAQPNHTRTIEEDLEEIEEWLQQDEPPHTFGYYCGLQSIDFPPSKMLDNQSMKVVCKAFNQMMLSWNVTIDLPKELPLSITYTMTIDTLNQKIAITKTGFTGFDYCSGYAPGCIFKQYCPCLAYWQQKELDNE